VDDAPFTLVATVSPPTASDPTVEWTSSNPTVATVSEGSVNSVARVAFVREGEATIIATTKDGGIHAYCSVKVLASMIHVTGVTLNHTTLVRQAGTEPVTLVATVLPYTATNQAIRWTSTDASVARITSGSNSAVAIVTFLKAGSAAIIATPEDGGTPAYCNVTVTAVPVTGITLDQSARSVDMNQTSFFYLTPTVSPSNASNKAVTWTSDNPDVVTVNAEDGLGRVTLVSTGTTRVRATTADGGFQAYCDVTVTAIPVNVPVTGIQLDQSSRSVDMNQTSFFYLTPTVLPSNASNKAVTWTSDNTGVVTVSAENGLGRVRAE
jgi:uncharacterized protein YjdB